MKGCSISLGNANQTHFIPTMMTIIKKTITRADKDVEKLKLLYTVGRSIKWCSHFGKQFGNL